MVAIAPAFCAWPAVRVRQSDRQPIHTPGYLCPVLTMFRKIIAFIICSIAIVLPWRLRCLYSEALGWITQFFYRNYIAILKYIIAELEKPKPKTGTNE